MSMETSVWLNTMTLIGDTETRGHAWHYRSADQGEESNHYPGAIPLDDVTRRLMDWEPIEAPLYVGFGDERVLIPDRKAIVANDDPLNVFGIFKEGYLIHSYAEWLLTNVSNLLDDTVHISSAGLLTNRSKAWVEISLSDVHTVADFPFRPHLLAYTSVDGTLATTYKRAIQAVVCDNTLFAAQQEKGQTLKLKHTKYSRLKLENARDALGLIIATADDFSARVSELIDWKITDLQWSKFLDQMIPTQDDNGKSLSKIAVTKADTKRERIQTMWVSDSRCAPWKGTAFGALQTFNTWQHHERSVRGDTIRPERNMLEAINGKTAEADAEALRVLAVVSGK